MNVLYHLTIPRPAMPRCEAVWQEIDLLRERLGGELIYLNPSRHWLMRLPRLLYGFHRLPEIRRREAAGLRLHNLYNPDPYPFPVVKWLRRPVVYTLSAGLRGARRPVGSFFTRHVHTIVVADRRDQATLAGWGLTNSWVVRPGIDLSRFTPVPRPLGAEFALLVGSAPWVQSQFRAKGVDTLLDLAAAWPRLRLVFLWRGALYDEMLRRVQQRGLSERVEILNRRVDVNRVLARVHASIVLAKDPAIIRAFPRSSLESLAAGKPVLVSRGIPLADVVAQTGCGQVVEAVTPQAVRDAVEALMENYALAAGDGRAVAQRYFSQERMVDELQALYRRIGG